MLVSNTLRLCSGGDLEMVDQSLGCCVSCATWGEVGLGQNQGYEKLVLLHVVESLILKLAGEEISRSLCVNHVVCCMRC